MPRAPRWTGRELIAAPNRHGFLVLRVRGSHHFLKHSDGRATVVPVHGREIIGPGLLNRILRDCDLELEDLGGRP
ncbi:MAG: type II toxin-antitoxin system HicA family toxin [Planctomycetota bacterium]